jgi:hypothetical protein
MAEGKKSFILYADYISIVSKLPDEKAGQLFKIILQYVNDEDPKIVNDLLLEISFEPIKMQLKRDLKNWEKFREKQASNGKQGGRPKKPKPLNENPENPGLYLESQKSLNVNVNDTVNDIVKDKSFTVPDFYEFENYCIENGFQSISKKAYEYYSVANWKDSTGKKVKNWKQKLQAVWFRQENKDKPISRREGETRLADGSRLVC